MSQTADLIRYDSTEKRSRRAHRSRGLIKFFEAGLSEKYGAIKGPYGP
jgi:hypothetical protein